MYFLSPLVHLLCIRILLILCEWVSQPLESPLHMFQFTKYIQPASESEEVRWKQHKNWEWNQNWLFTFQKHVLPFPRLEVSTSNARVKPRDWNQKYSQNDKKFSSRNHSSLYRNDSIQSDVVVGREFILKKNYFHIPESDYIKALKSSGSK